MRTTIAQLHVDEDGGREWVSAQEIVAATMAARYVKHATVIDTASGSLRLIIWCRSKKILVHSVSLFIAGARTVPITV